MSGWSQQMPPPLGGGPQAIGGLPTGNVMPNIAQGGQGHYQPAIGYATAATATGAQPQLQFPAAAYAAVGGLNAVAAAAAQDSAGDQGVIVAPSVAAARAGPIASQLFVCPQCSKGLKSQAGLTSHMQHCKPEKIIAENARNPQEKALKISTKRREQWDKKFQELVKYKEEHRHCKVPSNDKDNLQLGRWVSAIRREYKKRSEGKKNQLTDERVLKLVGIGFDFAIHSNNWNQKYAELNEYKTRFGDCNVPTKYKDNMPLSIWVHRQRTAYRKYQEGSTRSGMTEERIQALEKIGFSFEADRPFIKRGNHVSWEDRIKQLQAFKDEHGHCRVPREPPNHETGEHSLGNWVALCRFNYRKKIQTLTEARIKELEDMGFEWRLKGKDMTDEERKERKKLREETELRRKINRELRKRKHSGSQKKGKKAKTSKKDGTDNAEGSAAVDSAKVRTYFGHVPKPADDGGPPPLPTLPPKGWETSDRQTRIEAARRAAEYYGRMAQAWANIAQEEEEEGGEMEFFGSEKLGVDDASASEGYAADESEAVEAI